MPHLPNTRIEKCSPFQHVGLDYFGPIVIKTTGDNKKVWVCLFTCFAIRAIHLEIASDMTGPQFLNCLRRFIAQCGQPSTVISDNAPQFKVVDKTLDYSWNTVLTDSNVIDYCSHSKITWKFITQYSPWRGGMYERMVGLTKRVLRRALGRNIVTFETLITYLAEAEAIVNSRPLTHIDEDGRNGFAVLRPIDFLLPQVQIGSPVFDHELDDVDYTPTLDSRGKMLHHWVSSQKFINTCWDMFIKQYLTALHERYQSIHKQRHTSDTIPKVGAVVMIEQQNVARGFWTLGKIVELRKRNDGQISTVRLLMPNGKITTSSMKYLYPLEIDSATETTLPEVKQDSSIPPSATTGPITRSMTKQRISMSSAVNSAFSQSTLFLVVFLLMFTLVSATDDWLLFEAFSDLLMAIPNDPRPQDEFRRVYNGIPANFEIPDTPNPIFKLADVIFQLPYIWWWIQVFGSCYNCPSCWGQFRKKLNQSYPRLKECVVYQLVHRNWGHGIHVPLAFRYIFDSTVNPTKKLWNAFAATEDRFTPYLRHIPKKAQNNASLVALRLLRRAVHVLPAHSKGPTLLCVTVALMFGLQFQIVLPSSTNCPKDVSISFLEGHECVTTGISVFQANNGNLCWKTINCT